jgi:DNA-directed RNA polymerase III subunit RPC5
VEAYDAYRETLFLKDPSNTIRLKSAMSNEEYLEAISAPRHDPSGRQKKKPLTKRQRQAIELSDDSDELEGETTAEKTLKE